LWSLPNLISQFATSSYLIRRQPEHDLFWMMPRQLCKGTLWGQPPNATRLSAARRLEGMGWLRRRLPMWFGGGRPPRRAFRRVTSRAARLRTPFPMTLRCRRISAHRSCEAFRGSCVSTGWPEAFPTLECRTHPHPPPTP